MESLVVVLKWIAQGLILVVGVWGLLSDPYETDAATGGRRLTRTGWLKVVLLGIGFVLFGVTDVNERAKAQAASIRQSEQLAMQEQTIDNQERQLRYSQKLLLLQHQVSALDVSLVFPPEIAKRFLEEIMRGPDRPPELRPDATRLAYISTAARLGDVFARYRSRGDGYLDYAINRGQGFTSERIDHERPEWSAFVAAFQGMFGRRFEIRSESGRVLVDLLQPQHQMTVRPNGTEMSLALQSPGIRLDELQGEIVIVCGVTEPLFTETRDEEPDPDSEGAGSRRPHARNVGPVEIRLRSRDPRVLWDQRIELEWQPFVTRKVELIDPPLVSYRGEWRAGPYRVEADFEGIDVD